MTTVDQSLHLERPPDLDPRVEIGQLPDSAPLTMFPVRLETRFADAGTANAPRPQLWVRIYPDDVSIDTFEASLSDSEVAAAKIYWQCFFAAGGVAVAQRAAWSALVGAFGSGRAGFVLDTYQPVNLADVPVKVLPSDEVLVIATQNPTSAADSSALTTYWVAVWLADGNAVALQAAATALTAAVGSAHAADLVAANVPVNLSDRPAAPATKAGAATSVAFVVFPADPPRKPSSWTQAPQVTDFPERFVVLGYQGGTQVLEAIGAPVTTPLYVGPDPSADPSDSIHPDGDSLSVPLQLLWLVDFERAKSEGLAMAIDLTAEQARTGFDRLLVLGVQLGTNADAGQASLSQLLRHHQSGRAGLALVPQGSPTHNTTGVGTGYTKVDDPDQSFADRQGTPLFTPVADPMDKRDGQWVAEALGIDPAVLTGVHGAGGSDQLQARAMQQAMWPATLGYWMDKMMTPVFNDETVAQARSFFTGYVRGRGAVPSLRVGRQPYGILPTTAFSRIGWLSPQRERAHGRTGALTGSSGERRFLAGLLAVLREIDGDWTAMSAGAAHVGQPGDAHQILLDIIGLQPDSVEYYWRYSESLSELYNLINLWGLGPQFWQALVALGLHGAAEGLLATLGAGGAQPDILQHAFLADAGLIGQLIDDRPLSETSSIRAYTPDGRNYIKWLADAAGTSLDAVTAEQGFTGDTSPQALLYLMLRHAVLLGYYDSSYELHKSAAFLSDVQLLAMKPEPSFVHVDPVAPLSESRYAALYKTEARITGSPSVLVGDFITEHLLLPETSGLADQLAALSVLANTPTAALERAFAEHVDVCSYRFDAWLLGLVDFQLQGMRGAQQDGSGGTYLGAYAWVEDLRPSSSRLEPANVPDDVAATFSAGSTLMQDPANGGYVHAPSLPHARTAAVLRSGYLANATEATPDTLSVNLSSDRVRSALGVLEGVRNGQSIGALLGYQFERGLHDDHGLAEVDKFIFSLRKAFPLVADSLAGTQTDPDVPIEAIEARNVLDGRKLAEQIRTGGVPTYPFGQTGLSSATPAEADAINAEADAIVNVYDAVADLALAESVHQAVQGNFERVAATVDAYGNAMFPPDPEVVQTPTGGVGLTHRVAVHLQPGLSAPAGATPRAAAEPAVDAWLAELLPPLTGVGVTVTWTDRVGGAARSQDVTLHDLALHPRDLIELVKPDDVQAMTELDDRILRFVLGTNTLRPDATLQIRYQTAPSGLLSIFDVSALIRQLRRLLERSRPLRATDSTLSNQATASQNDSVFADPARVAGPKADLDTLSTEVAAFLTPLAVLLADPVTNRAAIIAGLEGYAADTVRLLERAARFGLPQAGWGFVYEWRRSALSDLLAAVEALVSRWDARLADYATQIAAYDALPLSTPEDARFAALQVAEALVATTLEPLPPLSLALRTDLDGMHTAFVNRRNAFAALPATNFVTFVDALTAVQTLLPISAWEPDPWDVDTFHGRAIAFVQDLQTTLIGQQVTIDARRAATQLQLDARDAAASPAAQVDALQAAAKALLGDAFVLVPEFTVAVDQGTQWAGSLAEAVAGGPLLHYLVDTAGIARPVQEWLAGTARVRPAMRVLEIAGTLAEAFGQTAPDLTAAQFPYLAGEPWMAMQFPESSRPVSDRLLYTAHYVTAFDRTAHQCGLLLDEWTEVVPATTRETGLTFDFDRPDNEPPQAILVVTPATADGVWHWEDVVGALNETLDLAKKRALEPSQIDATPYASFLPATIMAVTLHGISITTAMAVASNVLLTKEVVDRA
ncbi:hypothetical protein [Lapillicoccus sp.]|uniref:hypothetical protein n=1 Tax=Lapillicoccus sp. TaxID=1909287 RepID=UPI0032649923